MRLVNIACVQMRMGEDRARNVARAGQFVREAAAQGANVVLLPELFERPYFCQERRYEFLAYAEPLGDNLAVRELLPLTEALGVVVPVSFYEREGNCLFNSVALLECGEIRGVYRKTHIPDDHCYQEKFYFTPGDSGFRVFATRFGRVGVGICWDQWFPETARCLALSGAEYLLFPTAIGSEPILNVDSAGHWQRVMQGHAAANLLPVAAANRVGTERVEPCAANAGQSSSLTFYGSSFLTDETGAIVTAAGRDQEQIVCAGYDLDELDRGRLDWGLFRDRRPERYADLVRT